MKIVMKSLIVSAALAVSAAAQASVYKIDSAHSSVSFRVRHLVGHVSGQFDKFEGTFEYDPKNPKSWKTTASIDAASIDTKVEKRDNHLRSGDFLDIAKYPTLRFESIQIKNVKKNRAKLLGKLTLHGVTKTVVLDLEIGGVDRDQGGKERAAFTATTTLHRSDFGLTWNDIVESGKALVGEDVEITIEVEGVKEK